jgi:hypothetical protein
MTATHATFLVKYAAARVMNEAEPPRRSLWNPNGPSMSSRATEPTTS